MSEAVDFNITYNSLFVDIKAILHANGSLKDVYNWWHGDIDREFFVLIKHFYIADSLIEKHKNDVIALRHHDKMKSHK